MRLTVTKWEHFATLLFSLRRHSGRRDGVESASDVTVHSKVANEADENEGAYADGAHHLDEAAAPPLHHPHPAKEQKKSRNSSRLPDLVLHVS